MFWKENPQFYFIWVKSETPVSDRVKDFRKAKFENERNPSPRGKKMIGHPTK